MNLHLISRTGKTDQRRGGGIARSSMMIVQSMRKLGNVVTIRGVRSPPEEPPSDTDLVFIYCGDREWSDELLEKCRGFRVVVAGPYNGRTLDCEGMVRAMKGWERGGYDVYYAVYTGMALRDSRLAEIKDRLVLIPKTIRLGRPRCSFEERSGVCLGTSSKFHKKYFGGGRAGEFIQSLAGALPGVDLWVYGPKKSLPAGLKLHSWLREGNQFLSWLGTMRLFIQVPLNETFSMTPLEAQSVGTPVLYRPMPQSLSEWVGPSGVQFDTPEELGVRAAHLYQDKPLWASTSRSGRMNALSRGLAVQAAHLHRALTELAAR